MAFVALSKSNFLHNLQIIAQKTKSKDKIAVVLKDNAYGHGLRIMAQMAAEFGVTKAVVRTIAEAEEISDLFRMILVLAQIPRESPPEHIHLTINTIDEIVRIPSGSRVHLKVDTGMHRNGIPPKKIEEALEKINEAGLVLAGVFTHYRSADELSSELFWQQKNFWQIKERVCAHCAARGIAAPQFHSANSAALFRLSEIDEDFVRVGIAIYGYCDLPSVFKMPDLKPVLSLWAKRIASRTLPVGARIGYGGTYEVPFEQTVSTYDIGYADGFFRLDGSRSFLTASGKRILGRVSMDNFTAEGDEEMLCLFDDAKKIAEFFGTISYEILVKLPAHLKRVVVE